MSEHEDCYNCEGFGKVDADTGPYQGMTDVCPVCDGTGQIPTFQPSTEEATE